MNRAAIVFLIGTILTIASGSAQAFDGKRKGFQIGLGIGAHSSKLGYLNEYAPATVDAEQEFAISLQLGYGFSNRIVGHVGVRGGAVTINDKAGSLAIGGIGGSVYLSQSAPSLYLTGLFGVGALSIEEEADAGIEGDSGTGWLAGIGYEVTDRLHLELSHAQADLADPTNEANKTTMESSFLTVQYIWY